MGKIRETDTASENSWRSLSGLMQLLLILLFLPGTGHAASVVLNWDPSTDADLAGYKVYYQPNSVSLPFKGTGAAEGSAPVDEGNVTSATIDGLDPNNSYYFAVTAYNSAGLESVYSNIIEINESIAPVISLTSHASNAPVNGIVAIRASATDNVGVTKVQFFVNGTQVFETPTSPYVFSWDTSSLTTGIYTISAKAFDAAGNEGDATNVSVTVNGDTVPPTVSLVAPANNATASGSVMVSASANDNVGVARVEVYLDGSLVLTSNQNPASYSWNTAAGSNGSHVLSAKAYDAAGNAGVSSPVTVTVSNDTTVPVVSTSLPAIKSMSITGGGSTVTIKASAMDNVAVTKMQLYVDNLLQLESPNGSLSYVWTVTYKGAHTITAKAYDAAGNVRSQSLSMTK